LNTRPEITTENNFYKIEYCMPKADNIFRIWNYFKLFVYIYTS